MPRALYGFPHYCASSMFVGGDLCQIAIAQETMRTQVAREITNHDKETNKSQISEKKPWKSLRKAEYNLLRTGNLSCWSASSPCSIRLGALMTSKDPGHFLCVLRGTETSVCWTWTFPAAHSSAWPQLDWSLWSEPAHYKSYRLQKTRRPLEDQKTSDLIWAGQRKNKTNPCRACYYWDTGRKCSLLYILWWWPQQPIDDLSTYESKY